MQDEVDPSELFSSPIKPSDLPSQHQTPSTPKTPTPGPSREKAPFDADEARANALRRELEGVRTINEVIEGVIGTLERAKGNMGVKSARFACVIGTHILHTTALTTSTVRLANRHQRLDPPQHLDAHSFPDGAQPAPAPEQGLARRE